MNDKAPSFPHPNGREIIKLLADLGLTQKDFGEAIGYTSDADRTIRALIKGERHGRPCTITPTAAAALGYMLALRSLVTELAKFHPDRLSQNARDAFIDAVAILPKKLRP